MVYPRLESTYEAGSQQITTLEYYSYVEKEKQRQQQQFQQQLIIQEQEARQDFEQQLQEEKGKLTWKPPSFMQIRTPVYHGRTHVTAEEQRYELESTMLERMGKAQRKLSVAEWERQARSTFESQLGIAKAHAQAQFKIEIAAWKYRARVQQHPGFITEEPMQILPQMKGLEYIPLKETLEVMPHEKGIAWSPYAPVTPSSGIERALRKQLPSGATLTYYTEVEPGKYSVSYSLPKEEKETTTIIRADLGAPIADFLKGILEAPSWAEQQKAMYSDVAGTAIPITTEDVLMTSITVASIAAPFLQKKFWPTVQQSYYQSMSKMSKELFRESALEMKGIKQSANPEMWLNIQEPLETARFQPAEQWYRVTRGMPTTPMSKTLEAAIYGSAKGGLSAEQILVPQSIWKMPPTLVNLRMQPKTIPTTQIFPIFGVPTMQKRTLMQATITLPKPKQLQQLKSPVRLFERQGVRLSQRSLMVTRTVQLMKMGAITRAAQIQLQHQVQQLRLQTVQGLKLATSTPTRSVSTHVRMFTNFKLPQINAQQKLGKDLFGKWFGRQHRIRTPQEAARLFGMSGRKGGRIHL